MTGYGLPVIAMPLRGKARQGGGHEGGRRRVGWDHTVCRRRASAGLYRRATLAAAAKVGNRSICSISLSTLSTDMGIPMRGRIQNRATGPHSKLADVARGCRRATHGRDAGSRIGKTVGICGEISHIPQW